MQVREHSVRRILTRTSGYLATVTSHSLQPYRGCSLGLSLCGVGCYVRHNVFLTRGEPWGTFLEARTTAAQSYLEHVERERRWARRTRDAFAIFLSSSTEPFLPQEAKLGVTRGVLEAMRVEPPDSLIVQTHSHRVEDAGALLEEVAARCDLRVHISIETDRESLPGLPPHASSVARRFAAAAALRARGLRVIITVSPLLPIESPDGFFAAIARVADAVVIDHFIGGDGTPEGRRTLATPLPEAMRRVDPASTDLAYRDRMVDIASRHLPGRVGVGIDGFAGRWL